MPNDGAPITLTQVLEYVDGKPVTVADRVLDAVSIGAPRKVAAAAGGVSPASLFGWRAKGIVAAALLAAGQQITANQVAYADFAKRLDEADATCLMRALTEVQKVATKGYDITRRTTVEKTDGQGTVIEATTTTVVERYPPQWKANAWLLERRFPDLFGQRVVHVDDDRPLDPDDEARHLGDALREAYADAVDVDSSEEPIHNGHQLELPS